MDDPHYANPTLLVARHRLDVLFAAYSAATGLPETVVSKIARGDPKFIRDCQVRDFLHGSYDQAVSRLSALWPEGAAWPEEVPRLAPAEIDEPTLEFVTKRRHLARTGRARSRQGHEVDIPLPDGHRTQTPAREVSYG